MIYCAGSFASLGLLKPFTKQYFHICHRERWLKKLQNPGTPDLLKMTCFGYLFSEVFNCSSASCSKQGMDQFLQPLRGGLANATSLNWAEWCYRTSLLTRLLWSMTPRSALDERQRLATPLGAPDQCFQVMAYFGSLVWPCGSIAI